MIFFSDVVHTPAGFSRTESPPPPRALPCTFFVPELAMSNLFEALIAHYEKGIHSSALALVEKNINSKLDKSHICFTLLEFICT